MTRFYSAAAVMVVACLQASPLLAEDKAAPAPAASPAPSVAPAPASADKTAADRSASEPAAKPKPKMRIQMSAQTRQELDHSIKTRTVPSRYRGQVPKEYQKYIPFAR
ncbi:MAG: hypothetical protein V7634_2869 [Bradyrhizobium sp.]|jgi:hypothetical protein